MVGTSCNDEDKFARHQTLVEQRLLLYYHFFLHLVAKIPSNTESPLEDIFVDTQTRKILVSSTSKHIDIVERHNRFIEGNTVIAFGIYRRTYHLRIAAYNGAVVRVAGAVPFLCLLLHYGVKNPVDLSLYQPNDMSVNEFGGKTYIIAHHRRYPLLIQLHIRLGREYDLKTAFGKKRMPKRIILVHIQYSGYTYSNHSKH